MNIIIIVLPSIWNIYIWPWFDLPNRRQYNDNDIHPQSWNTSDERFLRYKHIYGSNKKTFFFRKHSWSLKTHFNVKMSEIRHRTPTLCRPKNSTLKVIQWHTSFDRCFQTSQRDSMHKKKKKLLNSFVIISEISKKGKKGPKISFRGIQSKNNFAGIRMRPYGIFLPN